MVGRLRVCSLCTVAEEKEMGGDGARTAATNNGTTMIVAAVIVVTAHGTILTINGSSNGNTMWLWQHQTVATLPRRGRDTKGHLREAGVRLRE